MEIQVKLKNVQRTYEVSEQLVEEIKAGAGDSARAETRWRDRARAIVEVFYGPTPESRDQLIPYLQQVAGGRKTNALAIGGIGQLLERAHPDWPRLDELERTPNRTEDQKAERIKLQGRIRAFVGMVRARILRYYLSGFGKLPKVQQAPTPPNVTALMKSMLAKFRLALEHAGSYGREEASAAMVVVTLLSNLLHEQMPAPSPELAEHLAHAASARLPELAHH